MPNVAVYLSSTAREQSRSESRVLGEKLLRSLATAVFQASHKDEAIHGGKPTLLVAGLFLQDCQEPRR